MSNLTLYGKATYRICIQGILDNSWFESIGDWQVQVVAGKTILIGAVQDQADLFGLLNYLYGLGIPLITVDLLEYEDS